MFRLLDEPLAPPRRNPEDVDEDLLEGLGAESLLLQAQAPAPLPVLRWRRVVDGQQEEQAGQGMYVRVDVYTHARQ